MANEPPATTTAGHVSLIPRQPSIIAMIQNITSLIDGLALLIFGSGPVRGFAVVHCLGIMTSIFTSVVVSRSMINLIYGRQKKLTKVHIGQIWRPHAEKTAR